MLLLAGMPLDMLSQYMVLVDVYMYMEFVGLFRRVLLVLPSIQLGITLPLA